MYEVIKFIETESRMVVARGYREREMGSCLMGIEFPFCKVKMEIHCNNNVNILNTTELYI